MTITLSRTYHRNYTAGDLILPKYIDKIAGNTLKTLELTYKSNKKCESCIPEGKYIIKSYNSPTFSDCIKIYNVEGRTDILIHPGNAVENFTYINYYNKPIAYKCDSEGCILVGTEFEEVIDTTLQEQGVIFNSREGLRILLDYVKECNGMEELIIKKRI